MPNYFGTQTASRERVEGSHVVRQTYSNDLEEHTQHLLDWRLEYDQLDCGRFEGSFLDVRLPGLQLFMERTNRCLRQQGGLNVGSVGMGMMLDGQGELVINGVHPGRGGLVVVHDCELEMATPADCTFAGVVVCETLLQQASQDLRGRPLEARRGTATGLAAGEDHVMALLATLRRTLLLASTTPDFSVAAAAQQEVRDSVVVQLVAVLANARDVDAEGRASQRKWLVDRACEQMMARPDEPPSLDEVCRTVGASPRKLNYCFHDVLGMSPNRYIRTLRLNAVRRELRRCTNRQHSVYDVAARWGFWHFGRFSSEYKRQFCESPSQSLRRARIQADRMLHT